MNTNNTMDKNKICSIVAIDRKCTGVGVGLLLLLSTNTSINMPILDPVYFGRLHQLAICCPDRDTNCVCLLTCTTESTGCSVKNFAMNEKKLITMRRRAPMSMRVGETEDQEFFCSSPPIVVVHAADASRRYDVRKTYGSTRQYENKAKKKEVCIIGGGSIENESRGKRREDQEKKRE